MDLIKISDAARELGIPSSLISYYADKGLLAFTGDGTEHKLSSYENDELRKIVLLQTLGINITDIGRLQKGEALLNDVLKARIDAVMGDPEDVTQSAIVCQNIRLEGCDYRSLDPMPHIEHIREMKAKGGTFPEIVIPGDTGFTGRSAAEQTGPFGETTIPPIVHVTSDSDAFFARQIGYSSDSGVHSDNPFEDSVKINGSEAGNRSNLFSMLAGMAQTSIYPHPFIRFFARLIDTMISLLAVTIFIRLVFGMDPMSSLLPSMLSGSSSYFSFFFICIVYLLMLAVEPLFLHFWGTTPGKFVFGLRLRDYTGDKLSLGAGYERSFKLLRYGYGFLIPFYILYRYFKSLMDCQTGHILPWDLGVKIERPEKPQSWRAALLIPVLFVISFFNSFSSIFFEMPKNKAPLTEDTFYENFAYVANYNSISTQDFPEYDLTVENGVVRAVSFTISETDTDTIYLSYYPMYVAFMAFAGAQESAGAYSINYRSGAATYFTSGMSDFDFEYAGVKVTNDVEYTGYNRNIISGYLYKNADEGEHTFKQVFTMSLE